MTDHSLFYNIDDHGEFYKNTKLIDDVKLYDIAADKNTIYLVCLTLKEELCYLTYTNNEWKETIIEKSDRHSTIRKIHIYAISDTVHIFYESLNDGARRSKLYHMHHSDNKWMCNNLNTNNLSLMHNYFIDSYNNGDIIVFYYSLMQNKLALHAILFSQENKTWSKDRHINSAEIGTNIMNLFIDSKNQLHILYHYADKLYWKKFNIIIYDPFIKLELLDKSILIENTLNKSYLLFECNNQLWVSWKISDEISYLSNNDGSTWTTNQPLLVVDSHTIKYISYPNEATPLAKAFITYNIKYNDKSFILGLDDVPEITDINDATEQLTNNELVEDNIIEDNDLVESNITEDNDLMESNIVEANQSIEDKTLFKDNSELISSDETDENNNFIEYPTEVEQEEIAPYDTKNILDNDINTIDTSQLLTSKSTEPFITKARKKVESFIENLKNFFH